MIRVDAETDENLRSWANGWLEGEMTGPSSSAGRYHRLPPHRDAIKGHIDEEYPEYLQYVPMRSEGGVQAREPSEGKLQAARTDREIRHRLVKCSREQVTLIRAAYKRPTAEERRGLGAYELRVAPETRAAGQATVDTFCVCVLKAPSAWAVWHREDAKARELAQTYQHPRVRTEAYRAWVIEQAHVAEGSVDHLKGVALKEAERGRRKARATVEELLAVTERDLAMALIAYGAKVEGYRLPDTTTLRQLGKLMGLNHETVRDELGRRKIAWDTGPRGMAARVDTRQLPSRWPEAAQVLAESAA